MRKETLRITTWDIDNSICDIREIQYKYWDEEVIHKHIQNILEEYSDISEIMIKFVPEN